MIDWDDVRYFLAVARGGSVRAAAEHLRVNHTTVLRRIGQLEERLGAHMFEKLPSGYRLTEAAEEILEFADQMEASSHRLESRVFGRDQSVRGPLRVTLAPPLATHLLMPDFADFAQLHPGIEIEILSSDEPVNLTNRQADVAIRVVYERSTLPLNLHGLKGPEVFGGVYMSRDLLAAWRAGRRGADRRGAAGARDDDAGLLRRRFRSGAGEGAGDRPAHARNALAAHTGGDAQDQAGAALHRVRVPPTYCIHAASCGTVSRQRVTSGGRRLPCMARDGQSRLRRLAARSEMRAIDHLGSTIIP
jgi:DNA-binding transcriptional LysR family regulator